MYCALESDDVCSRKLEAYDYNNLLIFVIFIKYKTDIMVSSSCVQFDDLLGKTF